MVSVLDGIRATVSRETRIGVARGCDVQGENREGFGEAIALARASDVAVVLVGGKSGLIKGCTSGEANDRAEIGLPGVQAELVRAVAATGTPTVVVLINGRPLALSDFFEDVGAVLEAWLPGEEGGPAVAEILFGVESPAGRLPVTLPRAVGQLPLYYNHKPSGARSQFHGDYSDLSCRPLLPFGHGLSYTRFDYANLELSSGEVTADECLEVACEVINSGDRPGEEVVQLYVNDQVASVTRPVKELKGFCRVAIKPGETRRIAFELDMHQLAFYDRDMRCVVEPGAISIMLGSSSEDIRLEADVLITGEKREVQPFDAQATRVRVT
jgi:beta-glucosidase